MGLVSTVSLRAQPVASQPEVQSALNAVEAERGLPVALEELFQWALGVGYFPEGVFEKNLVLEFPDDETPIVFRTQINYSRLAYQQPGGQRAPGCPICFAEVASSHKPLLRAYEFSLGSARRPYFIQLTPFPLRRRHYILIQTEHSPMRVGRESIDELLDFVQRAPNFTACSNSDVRDAGVSILDHHHYQVFAEFDLPVMMAQPIAGLQREVGGCEAAMLEFPLSVVRVRGNREALLEVASGMVAGWKGSGPGRNTCNVMVRRYGDALETYLFLRNPDFLTPRDLVRIKSEAVGIVEACGEAIYPPSSDEILAEVRRDGLRIFKRILAGLSPVPRERMTEVFGQLTEWGATCRKGNTARYSS